jgi:branched-chain amino acid transport system substrate-binding protein
VNEEHVDVIIGPSSIPTVTAVSYVAAETHTPQIGLSPLAANNPWAFQIAQPMSVILGPVLDHMKAHGARRVAFLGFSDAFGDNAYAAFAWHARRVGLRIVANERYARTDTSVTAQVLKIMAAQPDAVLVAAASTPAALPQISFVERGFRRPIYYVPPLSKDFLRVAGKAAEGAITATGPGTVPEQLPNSNPMKATASDFKRTYERSFGQGSWNQFAGYAWDAYLLLARAVPVALKKAKPGTPEFRQALRDALEASRNVVGTSAIFNLSPADHAGVDARSVILVRVQNGEFRLVR